LLGEQVIITKHGHPVALIIPFKEKEELVPASNIIAQLEAFNRSHKLGGEDWKTLKDEGRKYRN
jgi:antitoxin (DNA-binding transcriptional repressor) of toxin-antitoxin stability system